MTARRTLAIAAAALLCGVGDVVLVLGSERFTDPEVWAVFGPVVGCSFVGTGLYAWRRRPESRTGMLMVLVGFAWFLGPLLAVDDPLVFTIAILLSGLWGPAFGQLLLSFPTGRLPTVARRRLVAASYALVPLAPLPALLVSDADEVVTDCAGGCPRNVLLVSHEPGLRDVALVFGSAVSLVLCLTAVTMLVRQWRAAGVPERRSLAPLFAAGGLTLAIVAVYAITQVDALLWVAFAAFAATPFAFLAGLARADVSGSRGVRILMGTLGDMPERADLRGALSKALGDPALELAFWMPELTRYVDAAGSPVELPAEDDSRRTATEVHHGGAPVAVIVHDRAQDPETVRAAGAATALLLDHQRLEAELRARLIELDASRARLVQAADTERRRIERDLHDGAQSRLVALALSLRLARMRAGGDSDTAALLDTCIAELRLSLDELRDLARGIHPAVLSDRGLEPAVRALAARASVPVDIVGGPTGRLPAAVETAAYFVVSEALTNVAKYAHAGHATVRVERVDGRLLVDVSDDGVGGASAAHGSGLRGLSDRVAALSGTLEVSSPPGHGTRLHAELPCS
ncbi:MAG TPA: sensor histidine kinase [Microbacterium sp.]|nr:sensor histidine kinase [Microbacterium sp.]